MQCLPTREAKEIRTRKKRRAAGQAGFRGKVLGCTLYFFPPSHKNSVNRVEKYINKYIYIFLLESVVYGTTGIPVLSNSCKNNRCQPLDRLTRFFFSLFGKLGGKRPMAG